MRMNEKVSSSLAYWWNGLLGVFGGISADAWMVLIALVGMLLTAFINNYWQRRRFNAEFRNEQD